MGVSRAVTASLTVAALVATATGVWWHGAGPQESAGLARWSAVAVGATLLGGFVLWHRPRNRYGHAHLTLGLLFGSLVLAAGSVASSGSPPGWVMQASLAWTWLTVALVLPLWVFVIAAFPDGAFHRRGLGLATAALAAVLVLLCTVAYLLFPSGAALPLTGTTLPAGTAGPLAGWEADAGYRFAAAAGAVLGTGAPLLALVALADRYRTSGLVVRQQIKWLLLGATISVLIQTIPVQSMEPGTLRTTLGAVVVLAVPLPLLAAALAIFRYRLWDIDVVISHSLVYAVVSGVLSVAFVAAAVLTGLSVAGTEARVVAAVVLALLVSLLARPLRSRLVARLARALFGDEPRGLLALSRMAGESGGRDAVDRARTVADAARAALAAPWAQVWLHLRTDTGATLRPLASSGDTILPPLVVPRQTVGLLTGLSAGRRYADLPPDAAALLEHAVNGGGDAVVSLVVDGDLLGLLACGARPRDPYGDEDFQLLAALARESALGLQNLHLEEELRQRIAMIEEQAADLRRSRQRLVTAQDQERRRIERDLHDGAQQQLVALAARLRRHAGRTAGDDARDLTEFADEAEEAVFTLQELARGIYPSLLSDRGLRAALQAHAARLPVQVRVESDPGLHARRLPQEVESVLYYVALEAMTNAVRHAPGASISVSLSARETARSVVLEVHDDGPGLAPGPTRGDGLQNMADRVASANGVFSVRSAPGAGTWVRAEVPEPATVTGLRDATASPADRSAPRPPAG